MKSIKQSTNYLLQFLFHKKHQFTNVKSYEQEFSGPKCPSNGYFTLEPSKENWNLLKRANYNRGGGSTGSGAWSMTWKLVDCALYVHMTYIHIFKINLFEKKKH